MTCVFRITHRNPTRFTIFNIDTIAMDPTFISFVEVFEFFSVNLHVMMLGIHIHDMDRLAVLTEVFLTAVIIEVGVL